MNYKTILFITFILIQVSCKQKDAEDKAELVQNKPTSIQIDKSYQVDEQLTNGEKLQVKSVIHFSKTHNSPKVWRYALNMKQGGLQNISELTNGNILYLGREGDGSYNYTPFVLILDKEGKKIAKQKITVDSKSTYNFYEPLVSVDNQGGFTLYVKKEINSLNNSDDDTDESRMRNTLAKYCIDKIKFDSNHSGYKTESKSMQKIFLKPLQEKGFSYITTGDFSLKYLKDKVIVSGTASKPNQDQIPFIAILDSNLNLLKMNSFEGYPETKISDISLSGNDGFYVEGIEYSAADGTYYSTNKRFILNGSLKVITDKSDKEPFESVYRGPSAPEIDEEEVTATDDSKLETKEKESEEPTEETSTASSATFYTDVLDNSYYNINEKAINSSEVVFEKKSNLNNTSLWQIRLAFADNYEVPYTNSTKGFKRSNGDFVFSLFLRNEAVENGELSVAIFVFNKEGHLIRQFETPGYFGLTDFEMRESEGKLITGFVSSDAKYINNEWVYSYTFRSIGYSLE